MKPFALQFKETPKTEKLDYTLIEYDEELNLSVNKKTRQPAIDVLTLDTETFTKSQAEATDSDNDGLAMLFDTATQTFTQSPEESDDDRDRRNIRSLMDTSTITESRESVDQDK